MSSFFLPTFLIEGTENQVYVLSIKLKQKTKPRLEGCGTRFNWISQNFRVLYDKDNEQPYVDDIIIIVIFLANIP